MNIVTIDPLPINSTSFRITYVLRVNCQ